MMWNKPVRFACFFVAGLLLSAVLLFTAMELVAFDLNHYMDSYARNEVSQDTGIEMEDLEVVTLEIIDYMRCRQDELNPRVPVDGQETYIFDQRERLHMVDVKNLFVAGKYVRNSGLLILVLSAAFMIWKRSDWPVMLSRLFTGTLVANLGVLALLVLGMVMDFTLLFDWFHYILFDNDLWRLPPTSFMLRMVPEVFFFNTALKIGAIYLAILAALTLAGRGWLRISRTMQQTEKS